MDSSGEDTREGSKRGKKTESSDNEEEAVAPPKKAKGRNKGDTEVQEVDKTTKTNAADVALLSSVLSSKDGQPNWHGAPSHTADMPVASADILLLFNIRYVFVEIILVI